MNTFYSLSGMSGEILNPDNPVVMGAWWKGSAHESGKWIDVKYPYTGKTIGRVALMDDDFLHEAITTTAKTKLTLSRHERGQILNRMAAEIEANEEAVAHLITSESGLSLTDTRYEVGRAVSVLKLAAIAALQDDSEVFPCDVVAGGQSRRIYTMRQPVGLIGAITPFNHPLNQVVHKVAPAIVANAPIVVKPSEKTPLSAYYLGMVAAKCGWPAEAFTVINGDRKTAGPLLVSHPAVKVVSFTGSTAVGKWIAAHAGFKKLVLELGGSSVLIVHEDFEPEAAARIAASGIFVNSGQRCTNIRRMLVHQSIADKFAETLAAHAHAWLAGNPLDEHIRMGTLIDEAAATQIFDRVGDAIHRGGRLLAGNRHDGALYLPTVVDKVENHFPLAAEETFGPVATILRYNHLHEAIAMANDTAYGLSGAVATHRWDVMQRVITELETGTVNVNIAPGFRLEWSPFGGVKDSGLGVKEGVLEAVKAYTYVKTYSLPWDRP